MSEFVEKIKSYHAVISAIIAILAAASSAIIWIAGYFATTQQLNSINCYHKAATDSLSQQIIQIAKYNEYISKSNEIIENEKRLKNDPSNSILLVRLEQLKREQDNAWNIKTQAENESRAAINRQTACISK